MQSRENAPLSSYTTFHIGGPARFLIVANSVEDITEALEFARAQQLPVFVLGGGSNTLARDEGFDGVVIKLKAPPEGSLEMHDRGDVVAVVAHAGESWDALVAYAVLNNVWGLENLSGIPGSVGGAIVQGIGAYGAAVGQTLESVRVFNIDSGETREMGNAECQFDYRDSFFKHDGGKHVVLDATFVLKKHGRPDTSYKDLAARFADATPSVGDVRAAVLEIRHGKFPDISKEGTAGSFFKNPIMSAHEAEALKATYPDMPLFAMPETEGIKVPLAWLLDNALHLKGTRVGGARLFENQVLVIAAEKNTSAHDVQELASLVQKKVFDELKIKIEPEVKIL